ncbi:hypothetical protein BKA67DRAFT_646615 [Truncatella angustata]|uniref:Uncharacterized protein n=1 Tax=Truncatella angustata TaxID=152316 RepID=A0A9P8UI23_9PEZI|nr:uncharacterized protein BKA67DRAFT_646615 [Truncatella angustata]KAH6652537.1 hypothetical protein BKA67DRAFT_646615 [Truncatella angustata]
MGLLDTKKSILPSSKHSHGKSHKLKHSDSSPDNMGKVKSTSKHKNEQRVNFLFVVNEYNLNPNHAPAADRWGNIVPPETWEDYAEEHEGRVFRYCGGIVSTEETYTWHRPGLGLAGKIGFWQMGSDELGNPMEVFCALEKYSDFSMFNCGPFLPTIYGAGDVSEDDGCFDGWRALHFSHVGGISQASPNGGYKYVAGQNAGFIDVLLPKAYANADPNAPQSAGLGGQVGLVIGLMALSQRPGPTLDEEPRGVLVHIAIESSAETAMVEREIQNFEWSKVFVAG